MDDGADDEISREIDVTYSPRPEVLADLDISPEEFEAALIVALDEREELANGDDLGEEGMPYLEEMLLKIRGVDFKLEDLADIETSGDLA